MFRTDISLVEPENVDFGNFENLPKMVVSMRNFLKPRNPGENSMKNPWEKLFLLTSHPALDNTHSAPISYGALHAYQFLRIDVSSEPDYGDKVSYDSQKDYVFCWPCGVTLMTLAESLQENVSKCDNNNP